MEITVERVLSDEKELMFVIRCFNPHQVQFGESHLEIMRYLDNLKAIIEGGPNTQKLHSGLLEDIFNKIHSHKEEAFSKIMKNITFAISNSLEEKYIPIQREIYNWIYDHQTGDIKQWLQEFDPQRVKYYFDNDRTIEDEEGKYDQEDE